MSRAQALDVFDRAVRAALADEPTVAVRVADDNDPKPDGKLSRSELRFAYVHIVVPTVMRSTDSLGQGAPRSATGAAMIHVTVSRGEGSERAQRVAAAITDHLEADLIDELDIRSIVDGPTGERWGGAWWGVSLSVEFHLVAPDNQRARST